MTGWNAVGLGCGLIAIMLSIALIVIALRGGET